jgi:hypothetical protein
MMKIHKKLERRPGPLYKKADAAGLAVLIFEAMLLGSAERTTESKDDDALSIAASLFKIDTIGSPRQRRQRGAGESSENC